MSTTYHPYEIELTDGQKKKLQKAYVSKAAVTLRVKPEQIGRGDELLLTATQISRLKKNASAGKGMEIKLSQTQIQNTAQRGGNLFSSLLRPFIKPALGALASAGLSFGAEKVLNKMFGKGYGPKEIELYKRVQQMNPLQKKEAERYLVGQGLVRGGAAQYGGFLGMLASIGVPLAIDLVRKLIGKGLQTKPPRSRQRRSPPLPPPPKKGKGMQIRPPPFFGTWDGYYLKKKLRFEDKPLSNIDLRKWCNFLQIPIKGIFSRNETRPMFHSPCIINLDDFGSLGTHWVCC